MRLPNFLLFPLTQSGRNHIRMMATMGAGFSSTPRPTTLTAVSVQFWIPKTTWPPKGPLCKFEEARLDGDGLLEVAESFLSSRKL